LLELEPLTTTGPVRVDDLAAEGKAWVNQGTLAATGRLITTTQIALEMLVRAIGDGAPPTLRALIDLNSYPPLETLSAKGKEMVAGN
jgi:hypothetical protein